MFASSNSKGVLSWAVLVLSMLSAWRTMPVQAEEAASQPRRVVLAIHGGAGTVPASEMTPDREAEYRAALKRSLEAGHAILDDGGSSLDAVVAAILVLEESPLFNAGVGAVFTHDGTVELDASVMTGHDLQAGAVASVAHVKSPILLARRVLEASPHVMLIGPGAEVFAREQGLELVENEYFYTERRREQLQRALEREAREAADPDAQGTNDRDDRKFGTVGAVALDAAGNLAAGTSTGGLTNKRFGRVGDSPIIGAGTYADNATCAVSATGHGEYFIRGVVAHEIAAMMRYANLGVAEAASAVVHGKLTEMGGTGGVIALDREGRLAMPFNTEGMYRGSIDAAGEITIELYRQ